LLDRQRRGSISDTGRCGAVGEHVRVSFYATLRPIVGAKTLDIDLPEGSSIEELLDHLISRWPPLAEKLFDDEGRPTRRVQVFVDGRSASHLPDGLRTKLRAGHAIDIFPAVAGG
jgi:molybdopterin synthase sulfur carrier subunit